MTGSGFDSEWSWRLEPVAGGTRVIHAATFEPFDRWTGILVRLGRASLASRVEAHLRVLKERAEAARRSASRRPDDDLGTPAARTSLARQLDSGYRPSWRDAMTAVIKTERLTKSYGEHRGIAELDLEVAEGEIFGFLGPNGAGKTTTMRVLLDLIRPTSGRAEVFGIETTADPGAIHRRVGYLPGEFDLYDRLTGAQTITYFGNLRGGVDKAYVAKLVEALDLDPSRRFKEYSKGNKQKVGLIVALQHRPDLLILDEPTSGLDPLVQQTFFGLVREARDDGRTIFLSSHIIDEVDRTCDRVAIIREGRLVQVDRIEAIRELAFHHVELTFAAPVAAAVFEGLPGVSDIEVRGPHRQDAGQRPDRCGHHGRGPARHRRRRQSRAEPRGRLPRPVRRPPGRRRRTVQMTTDDAGPDPARSVVAGRRARHDLRQDRPRQLAGGAGHRRRSRRCS